MRKRTTEKDFYECNNSGFVNEAAEWKTCIQDNYSWVRNYLGEFEESKRRCWSIGIACDQYIHDLKEVHVNVKRQ